MSTNVKDLLHAAESEFANRWGGKPSTAVFAPGRVNIIGEHTDYNEGFVMPMALDLGTVVVGRLVPGRLTCRVRTLAPEADAPQEAEFTLPAAGGPRVARGPQHWLSYVQGVIQFFAEGASTSEAASEGVSEAATKPSPSPSQKPRAYEEGLELVVASNVPLGGGLSSSASLEVATYTLLAQLYLEPGHRGVAERARICQRAEHEYAGIPCGLMDQTIALGGQRDHCLLIDCRSQTFEAIPVNVDPYTFLVINSRARHELASGEYAKRRKQCYAGASYFHCKSLRELSEQRVEADGEALCAAAAVEGERGELVWRRSRHVVHENARTVEAAAVLRAAASDAITRLGALMLASHRSLQHDFEVSCVELDQIVDLCLEFGAESGAVAGARMTGGGFGGCVVTLVRKDSVDALKKFLLEKYSCGTEADGSPRRAHFIVSPASPGVSLLY